MSRLAVYLMEWGAQNDPRRRSAFGVYASLSAAKYAANAYSKHNFLRAPVWVDTYNGGAFGNADKAPMWSITKQEVKGKARVEAPEGIDMAKTFDWAMPPFEREALASWLQAYNGYSILLDTALSTPRLSDFGVTWDAGQRRLKYQTRSAEVPVHTRQYFERALHDAQGRGELAAGVWMGVWMIDVAAALLSLAGIEHDPTAMLTPRSLRYKTIITMLKGEGDSRDAEDIVGEIRG